MPTKKTRAQLTYAFREDAVPTPDDFGAIIDAGINQADDGIDINDNTISISKPTTIMGGLTMTDQPLTIGQENVPPPTTLAFNVHAPFTASREVTLRDAVTAKGKITAAGGIDVQGTALNIGTSAAGLPTTIYNTLNIAPATVNNVTTPGKLFVDSIAAISANTDLSLSGQGTNGAVAISGKLLVDSITATTTNVNQDLSLAARGTTGKIKVMGPLNTDTIVANTTNGDLKLAGDGVGKVVVTTPFVVGASDAAVASTIYGTLTLAPSTLAGASTVYGSLAVDSIAPSNTATNADLTLLGKGTGKVRITSATAPSTLAVDKIVPNGAGVNDNLTLAGNSTGSVLVTRPLTVGAVDNAVTATIYNALNIMPGSNATTDPSKLLVDNISPTTTNAALALSGNGTGGVTANRLQVAGTLWVGSTAAKQVVTVNGSVYADSLSSVTDNANLMLVPKGAGIVDIQKSLTISNGNMTISAGDLTIGQSGAPRTLTVNGNLVLVGSAGSVVWNVATLASGNSQNTTSGYGKVSYSKDAGGFVRLRGSANVSASFMYDGMYLITTLPEGYRPGFTTWFPISYGTNTSRTSAYVRISRMGQVCVSTTGSYFDLDGLMFLAEPYTGLQLPAPWLKVDLNGNATDSSAYNRSPTTVGISWVYDSQLGRNVASFAQNTSNIKFPNLTCPANYTFSLWVKRDANNANGWTDLIEFGNDNPTLYLSGNVVATTKCGLSNGPALESTRWYHLALSRNATSAQLYVDGGLVQSSTSVSSFNGVGLGLGYNSNDSIFKGLMSKVVIYDQALNADQIAILYGS